MQVYHSARTEVEGVLDTWGYDLVTEGYLPVSYTHLAKILPWDVCIYDL